MKFHQATRINGCTFEKTAPDAWTAISPEGIRLATCRGKSDKESAYILSEEILRQNKRAALARDLFRCVRCSSMQNLHAHHKIGRGMGSGKRDDRVENLETLCNSCHEEEHRGVKR